jgi:Domain of unknown function (DUF5659)
MQTMHEPIRISDVHLAAYLVAKGFALLGVEGQPSRREFLFTDVPPDAIVGYYNGELVSARALLDALRNLRGLLVQGLR